MTTVTSAASTWLAAPSSDVLAPAATGALGDSAQPIALTSALPRETTDTRDVGGDFPVAMMLGTLDEGRTIIAEDTSALDSDTYRFALANPSWLAIDLRGGNLSTDYYIYDASRSLLFTSADAETAVSTTLELAAGEYFLGVYSPEGAAVDYALYADVISRSATLSAPDAGGDFAVAKQIGTLHAGVNIIADTTAAADSDMFQVELAADATLALSLHTDALAAQLYVYDAARNFLFASPDNGDVAEFSAELLAGSYYIGVYSPSGAETSYHIEATLSGDAPANAATDTVGDTAASASDLGTLGKGTRLLTEQIDASDTDAYSFTLDARATVALRLSGPNGGRVLLTDADGNPVNPDVTGASFDLAAGRYTVAVAADDLLARDYALEVEVFPEPDTAQFDTGATAASGRDLGGLVLGESVVAETSFAGDVDAFTFSLDQARDVRFDLDGGNTTTAYTLSGADGEFATVNDTMTVTLEAGQYTLAVASSGGPTQNYALNLAVSDASPTPIQPPAPPVEDTPPAEDTPPVDKAEPPVEDNPPAEDTPPSTEQPPADNIAVAEDSGGDFPVARDFGVLGASGLLHREGTDAQDSDTFRFVIEEAGTFTLDLNGGNASTNYYFYSATRTLLDSSAETGSATPLTVNLQAGTYYVGVYSAEGPASNYDLNLSFASTENVADAGGDFGIAFDLGALGSDGLVHEENTGAQDSDTFRFTVDQAGRFSLDLEGGNASTNIYLYDGARVMLVNSEGGDASDPLSFDLQPGTYYAGVYSAEGPDSGYRLNLDLAPPASQPPAEDTPPSTEQPPTNDTPAQPKDSGGDFAVAQDLGALRAGLTTWKEGTDTNDSDTLRFEITEQSLFALALHGGTDATSLYLYDADQELIASRPGQAGSETIYDVFAPGVYYAGVFSADGGPAAYQLDLVHYPTAEFTL